MPSVFGKVFGCDEAQGEFPTTGEIATAVWRRMWSSETNEAGSYGHLVQNIGPDVIAQGGAGPWTTGEGASPEVVAQAVWDALTTDATLEGSFGSYVKQIVADILAQGGPGPWTTYGGGDGPVGPQIIDVIVQDTSSNVLANATVRYSEGAYQWTRVTDDNGQCSFALDAATYRVAITKPGYSFTPVEHVVTGSEGVLYQMIPATVPPPPNQDVITAFMVLYDTDGNPAPGVPFEYRMTSPPSGGGYGYEQEWVTTISDENGLVTIYVYPGATYDVKVGAQLANCAEYMRMVVPSKVANGWNIEPSLVYVESLE